MHRLASSPFQIPRSSKPSLIFPNFLFSSPGTSSSPQIPRPKNQDTGHSNCGRHSSGLHTSCRACEFYKHKTGKFTDKEKPGSQWTRFPRPPQPWTSWLPTEKGHDIFPPDEDIPWGERLKWVLNWWKEQAVLVKDEMRYVAMEREPLGGIGHCYMDNEVKIEYKFDNPDTFEQFTVSGDQDWDQGFSEAELVSSRIGTGIFRGYLDTAVPKDGVVHRTGWVNLKSDVRIKAFNRKETFEHWMNFTHFIIKGNRCNSIGITLMDRITGPFQLEIDWMGVYYDVSHREEFAYEMYKVPWGIH